MCMGVLLLFWCEDCDQQKECTYFLLLFRGMRANAHGKHTTKHDTYACFVGYTPDSKVHRANRGPIWGRQDQGGPRGGPISFAICDPFSIWDYGITMYVHILGWLPLIGHISLYVIHQSIFYTRCLKRAAYSCQITQWHIAQTRMKVDSGPLNVGVIVILNFIPFQHLKLLTGVFLINLMGPILIAWVSTKSCRETGIAGNRVHRGIY